MWNGPPTRPLWQTGCGLRDRIPPRPLPPNCWESPGRPTGAMQSAPPCWRRVIDFSGDSVNSYSGPPIAQARETVLAAGVTINALPILRPNDPGRAHGGLEALYAERIVGGPGAFVVTAENRASFAEAVKRKLILEISGQMPGVDVARND